MTFIFRQTEEDLFSKFLDMDKLNASSATSSFQWTIHHLQESKFQKNTTFQQPENLVNGSSERPRVRHQHSQSMDGSTMIMPEMLTSGAEENSSSVAKKSMVCS